jgi:hypothetical protein
MAVYLAVAGCTGPAAEDTVAPTKDITLPPNLLPVASATVQPLSGSGGGVMAFVSDRGRKPRAPVDRQLR